MSTAGTFADHLAHVESAVTTYERERRTLVHGDGTPMYTDHTAREAHARKRRGDHHDDPHG